MTGIELWSTTAADNDSAAPNGWPEGMPPSGVNDTGRQMMAAVREWYETAEWINLGHTPTYIGATSFSVTGDQTTTYQIGRRIKAYGTTPFTIYGTISNSAYASVTTVTVTWDSGSLNATLSKVWVSINSVTNKSFSADMISGSLSVSQGGTGRTTSTTAYGLIAAGTTATGAHQTLAAGATTEILVGGGASALPVWTTATGSGAPVRATSPTLVTPTLGVATATSINTGAGAVSNIFEAEYTATLTANTNITTATLIKSYYMRIGSAVTVHAAFDVTPTASGGCILRISLPISTNIASIGQCNGVGAVRSTAITNTGAIYGDTTNETANLSFVAPDTTQREWHVTFTYRI